MKILLKTVLLISGFILTGCGGSGGGSENDSTPPSITLTEDIEYKGEVDTATLTKNNIPSFLESLDVTDIKNLADVYTHLPLYDILNYGQNVSEEINGSITGNQVLSIEILNSGTLKVTHVFNNYTDEYGSINGIIVDTVDVASSKHTLDINNLKTTLNDIQIITAGKLEYISQTLVIQELVQENTTFNQSLFYQDFTFMTTSYDYDLYNGKVCISQEGCIDTNTTYDSNLVNSNIITLLADNIAKVSKDYTKDLLVNLPIDDTSDTYTYLVYDNNLTRNRLPLYEANVSTTKRTFFNEQESLENSGQRIKLADLNNDSVNELIFQTTNATESAFHIIDSFNLNTTNTIKNYPIKKGIYSDFNIINFNGDELKDIFFDEYHHDSLLIQDNNFDFTKLEVDTHGSLRTFISDFNGDGQDDRVYSDRCELNIYTDLNNSDEFIQLAFRSCDYVDFTGYQTYPNLQLITDFNNDGHEDMLFTYEDERDPIYNGNRSYFIMQNNGDGTVTQLDSKQIIDFGDPEFDSNGNMIIDSTIYLSLYGTKAFDFNDDGYTDFMMYGKIFINKRDNTFTPHYVTSLQANDTYGGEDFIGLKDINKDGIKDIVYSGYLGIRAILLDTNFVGRDILLYNDGDQRQIYNLTIGNITNNSSLDILWNNNNHIKSVTFK